jgi:Protein of unknown function (DUF3443)
MTNFLKSSLRLLGFFAILAAFWMMSACSSGNNTAVTGITVSCSPPALVSTQLSSCNAIVTGTGSYDSTVTWATSFGSISTNGLFTAPTVTTATTATITATSTQTTSIKGTATITIAPTTAANNAQPIVVDAGPTVNGAPVGYVNGAFVSVNVCVPGTSDCQTIDHVLVDTGSVGLILLSGTGTAGGELSLSLPQANAPDGNPLADCSVFEDGYTCGPVQTADIAIAGEKASSVPVHVLGQSGFPSAPGSCSSQTTGPEEDNITSLLANGILGVGLFRQDCGLACDPTITPNPPAPNYFYYSCSGSGCNPIQVPVAQQVSNPVIFFPTDNNGVQIQLPAIADAGASDVAGTLIFGIGTENNNALGSATVYNTTDTGTITTTFAGTPYPGSFIDSGSNATFFLTSAITGIPLCSGNISAFYCPSSEQFLTATNQGTNGSSNSVKFAINNANTLFNNNGGTYTAFDNLGGPSSLSPGGSNVFDWGLTFFFGKNVYTGIETAPGSGNSYFAY